MNKNLENVIDASLIGVGTLVGLSDIYNILCIAVLVVQGIWLVAKFVYWTVTHIKSKQPEKVVDDVGDLKNGLEDLKNSIDVTKNKKGDDHDGE